MKRILLRSAIVLLLLAIVAGFTMPLVAKLVNQQSELANQIKQISESMAALAKAQKAAPPAAAAEPLEIRGRVYLGDPARPVAGARVDILRVEDSLRASELGDTGLVVVRRVKTDTAGQFHAGPLQEGSYCVTTRLLHADGTPASSINGSRPKDCVLGWVAQSGPIDLLYAAKAGADVALDAEFVAGSVEFEVPSKFPATVTEGDTTLPVHLDVILEPNAPQTALRPFDDPAAQWPAVRHIRDRTELRKPLRELFSPSSLGDGMCSDLQIPGSMLSPGQRIPFYPNALITRRSSTAGRDGKPNEVAEAAPAGEALFDAAALARHNLPVGKYKAAARLSIAHSPRRSEAVKRDGPLMSLLLSRTLKSGPGQLEGEVETEVKRGKRTRLRVEVPDDWQARLASSDGYFWRRNRAKPVKSAYERIGDTAYLELPLKLVETEPEAQKP